VKNAEKYSIFLTKLMGAGRYKKISENNTYMFVSADEMHIEIKQKKEYERNFDVQNDVGFCLPCLRMKGAKQHLATLSDIEIVNTLQNPDGDVIFFKDYEGIIWHFKDYDLLDEYVNI
jgi:hypothetical protein